MREPSFSLSNGRGNWEPSFCRTGCNGQIRSGRWAPKSRLAGSVLNKNRVYKNSVLLDFNQKPSFVNSIFIDVRMVKTLG